MTNSIKLVKFEKFMMLDLVSSSNVKNDIGREIIDEIYDIFKK